MRAALFAFVFIACGGATRTDRNADAGDASPGNGGVQGDGGAVGSGGAASTPAFPGCSWPPSLDPADASARGACHAARALLTCNFTSGVTQICISDDPTACMGPFAPGGEGSCHDECSPNEYAASCGAIGPASAPGSDPPAGCRLVEPTPAGIGFYCCPCS